MSSLRRWPLVVALLIAGCGAAPTATNSGPPSAVDRARANGTSVALTREPIEQACRGKSGRGPKNCATATANARYSAAAETARAGGCESNARPRLARVLCNATAEAILTGTPPAPK